MLAYTPSNMPKILVIYKYSGEWTKKQFFGKHL